jgi:hypothetical protein
VIDDDVYLQSSAVRADVDRYARDDAVAVRAGFVGDVC